MKAYLSGSSPSIRVPIREIALTNGERLRLYDTSGPYTDPDFTADPKQGLPPLRQPWILGREDVEPGAGAGGAYNRRGLGRHDGSIPPAGRKSKRQGKITPLPSRTTDRKKAKSPAQSSGLVQPRIASTLRRRGPVS